MKNWNPRYLAYCKTKNLTPDKMLELDKQKYPGGCMIEFMFWIQERWKEWKIETKYNGLLTEEKHASFDKWLTKGKTMIDITGIDPVKFIKEVYNLSKPQGMGYLHFIEGDELTDEEVQKILCDRDKDDGDHAVVISMDYIKGRACKMCVWRINKNQLYIRDSWFDHTYKDLKILAERCGFDLNKKIEMK